MRKTYVFELTCALLYTFHDKGTLWCFCRSRRLLSFWLKNNTKRHKTKHIQPMQETLTRTILILDLECGSKVDLFWTYITTPLYTHRAYVSQTGVGV